MKSGIHEGVEIMVSFIEWLGVHNADNMLFGMFKEDLTREQCRAVWTTYCLMLEIEPDTMEYDNKLMELYEYYWSFSENSYEEFEAYMGALLY